MAKTLEIAGSNYLPFYKTGATKIRETLRKTNVMNFQAVTKDIADAPQEGAEIVLKDGARFLFGGFISRVQPEEVGVGSQFLFNVECSSYDYIFNSKIARRAYTNKTLKYIVEDLMSTYVASSYGFTTTNVQTGPTIDTVTFDHISIRKCFEKLSKLTGFVWYTDYERNLFFQSVTTEAAPETVTDSSNNIETMDISYDTSQVRNSVIVIGSSDGVESLDPITETFEGDGETRSWVLEEKPSTIQHIKLNGVTKQFSLELNERDTDYFVYNFESKSFRLVEAQPTPVGGGTPDEIEIKYLPRIPIVEQLTDIDSIAFFASRDGGDGKYEYTIKEASITSLEEAQARASQELSEYSMPLVEGSFTTRTGLLSGSSVFKPGQYLTVNLPSYGLTTDTAFLIQEVTIDLIEGATTEYKYTVKFGGKIVGIQEFLETIAAQQSDGDANNVDQIVTIEHVADLMLFEDVSISEQIDTPPYKYAGGGGPVGKWGLSEWA